MSKKIKCLFGFAISCVISFAVISLLPIHGEEKLCENVIRLHVIANSDSEADQMLKLDVRDSVLEKIEEIKSSDEGREAKGKFETEKNIEEKIGEIKETCEKTLREKGCNDSVNIVMGKEKYPVRYYDTFGLPCGTYTSLRVVIGEGDGHNWWCVLYPPLCTAASEGEREEEYLAAGFTGEEYRMIKSIKKGSGIKYKIRFKLLEMISDAIGCNY